MDDKTLPDAEISPSEAAAELVKKCFNTKSHQALRAKSAESPFASELGSLSFDNVFSKLWVRPGLDLRSRSLVTIGILIALRAREELVLHFASALANGCSIEELEEVIYHSSAYAGFPAAVCARMAAAEALSNEGMI